MDGDFMKRLEIVWFVAFCLAFAAGFLVGDANGATWAFEYADQFGTCD